MKIFFRSVTLLAVLFSLTACAALEKDNEPKDPTDIKAEVKSQLDDVYRPGIKTQLDGYGLAVMGGSIGDSALFSCLAYAAGAADFDPAILFIDGRPVRHPDIYSTAPKPGEPDYEQGKWTPVSKDMVNGILLCLHVYGKTHPEQARALVEGMIAYGRAHKENELWVFCPKQDRVTYNISDERWYGRCTMTPAVSKDTYRVAIELGWTCDDACQVTMQTGTNIPSYSSGFEGHLAVLTTLRNGLVEGAINDNSLRKVLETAAGAQPRNALYQAAFHLFGDGDQAAAYNALSDRSLFPADALPTSANYCTDYLFQRDDDTGAPEADWSPCGDGSEGAEGRGIDWVFAAAVALGEVK